MKGRIRKRILAVMLVISMAFGDSAVTFASETQVVVPEKYQTFSIGSGHGGAITEDGSLYMWGDNAEGQIGNGNKEPQLIPTKMLSGVISVSLGDHSGAITEDGSLYMWGANNYGQIGNGNKESQLTPVKVLSDVASVSLGEWYSAAITKDGSLYMWGENGSGQIGNGNTEDIQLTPLKVLSNVVSVCLGAYYSAAITKDGSLYMWGGNGSGQIGNGNTEDQLTPVKILSNVVSVSIGYRHSGAITEDGSLYMWGDNHHGQIGNASTETQLTPVKVLSDVVSVSSGYGHSGAITEDGSLYMWGYYGRIGNGNTENQLTPVKVLSDVVSVSLWMHSGAITEDGSLYMWGDNESGQIGNGNKESQLTPVKVLSDVASVSLDYTHSGAITEDGSLYMWGKNNYGQVGNGSTEEQLTPVKVLDNVRLPDAENTDDNTETSKITKSVQYFSKWDSENQIAYWGQLNYTGTQVTEETDLSFLEKVDELVGNYVLVETKSREDGLVGPDTLISIMELDTQKGVVTALDGTTVTIDGVTYTLPEDFTIYGISEGDSIVYHVADGELIELQRLKTEEGILTYWDADTRALKISTNGFEVNEKSYVLSELVDDETIEFLGVSGDKETSVKYVSDNNNLIYHMERNADETYPEFDGWELGDEWSFKNYSVNKIPLTIEDYQALTYNLSNKDKALVDSIINDKHGGQCYGMAVTSVLAKQEVLSLDTIGSGLETLYESEKTTAAKSVIGYYYLNQFTNGAVSMMEDFAKLSLKEQFNRIKRTQVPYVLCFGCDGWGAHAVTVVGYDEGSWTYHGKTYDTRILTYDSNYGWLSSKAEESYLYFNSVTFDWEIPNYYENGLSSYNGGYFICACNDIGVLNSLNLEEDRDEYSVWVRNRSDCNFEITSTENSYLIQGIHSEDADELRLYYDVGYNIDSPATPVLNVELKEASDYIITSEENTFLDMSILYPNYYMAASSDLYESVGLEENGTIEISGLEGEYEVTLVANKNYTPLTWHTIELKGNDATEISARISNEGILISGDNLSDIMVTGKNSKETVELMVSSDEQNIMVTENGNGDMVVREDDDGDGIYEKDIFSVSAKDRYCRIYGSTRYETSYAIASALKEQLELKYFDTVILADGNNFPDALAGSYLAHIKDAPILMAREKNKDSLPTFIKNNLKPGGTIYVLGGTEAVPDSVLSGLSDYRVERLSGETRYETNLLILEEAGVTDEDILVCTGNDFADSLSASATGKPILLLNNKKLTEEQIVFLEEHTGNRYYIIGGTSAVSQSMENEIRKYGTTERVYGSSRYETSIKVAEKFFTNPEIAVLAYAKNFPDGLCGGPLAMNMDAPLILTSTGKTEAATNYVEENSIQQGYVLGGTAVLPDNAVRTIFDLSVDNEIKEL